MPTECQCSACVSACSNKPGWFLPGEAEKVAEYKGISLQDLFKEYLAVDWWDDFDGDVFLLAPAIVDGDAGTEYPSDPRGACIFLKADRCDIHAVKPFECRAYLHGESQKENHERHRTVMESWRDKQEQIKVLLGREPVSSSYSPFGFGWS